MIQGTISSATHTPGRITRSVPGTNTVDGNRHRPSTLCGDNLAQQPGPPAHELIWPLSTRSLRRGAKGVALTLGLPLAPRDYLLRSHPARPDSSSWRSR
jgi:hypothetical protein